MKVRWLGNAALEVFSDSHIWIDPNLTVEPKRDPDIILLTHEHDDHFSPEDYAGIEGDVKLFGPKTTLEKFDLDGISVKPGDEIEDIVVLDCDCYASDESVTYFYNGLLHAGDSAFFPDAEGVELIFTACFPDYYDDYISAFKRLKPELVVPFHYDAEEDIEDARGLIEKMDKEGIPNQLLSPADSIKL
ncbi:MAG: MBL fold metallo-hydrolase [Candidatus Thermoplasmatota archaeon]